MLNQTDLTRNLIAGLAVLTLLAFSCLPAQAVWHTVLSEHFLGDVQDFPWGNWQLNPARTWYEAGPPYVWGVQDDVFKENGIDTHSLWCCGLPPDLLPLQEPYPINMNGWAKWGPINLATAVAARASFSYYCITEAEQDYFRWGAWPSNSFNMYEAGRRSGLGSPNWYGTVLNFDSLQYAGGDTSLLGDASVWLELHFVSDGDNQRYIGAFVDELTISWDDGTFDLYAQIAELASLDSTAINNAINGDSIRFSLEWTAEGTGTTPDFDIICRLDGEVHYTERRNAEIGLSQIVGYTTYTDYWIVEPDTHVVTWIVDASQEVVEADEENNDTSMTFISEAANLLPWIIVTRPTYGDTAADQFVIRWEDDDPDDNAHIYFSWVFDTLQLPGNSIPGAWGLSEDDEADSFSWQISGIPEGEIWILGMIEDDTQPIFDFSAGPLIIDYDWSSAGWPIGAPSAPQEFALQSIFPNPFNSRTVLELALPKAAQAQVRAYDAAGRLRDEVFEGFLPAGFHEIGWEPANLPSGIYLLEFSAEGDRVRSKVVYLK
jgi:hypothetical protein